MSRVYQTSGDEWFIKVDKDLLAQASAEVRAWVEEQPPFEEGPNGTLLQHYQLDEHSELPAEEVAANKARRKLRGQMIGLDDVGERQLTDEEIAYNHSVQEKVRAEAEAAMNEWYETTPEGYLMKVATDIHQQAMTDFYGKEGSYGGTVSCQDGEELFRLSAGSMGGFAIVINNGKERRHYELDQTGEKWLKVSTSSNSEQLITVKEDELKSLAERLASLSFSAK